MGKIEEIIENSGNNFHYKVVEFLRNNGWYVVVSPFYSDNFTNKPREIDIIAEKEYEVKDFGQWIGDIRVRFFIECKYITNDTVFWFDNRDLSGALTRVLADTPLGDPHDWSMTDKHRYLEKTEVAKLFSDGSNKGPDNEIMYKAITQSLNSLVYYKQRPSIIPENPRRNHNVKAFVNYPIIVCNDFSHFWKYSIAKKDAPQELKDNFQLEVQYAYFDEKKENRNEYFLIDIVSFDNLEDFIKQLEKKDIAAMQEKIHWDHRT
jgi:hypothetical protein